MDLAKRKPPARTDPHKSTIRYAHQTSPVHVRSIALDGGEFRCGMKLHAVRAVDPGWRRVSAEKTQELTLLTAGRIFARLKCIGDALEEPEALELPQ